MKVSELYRYLIEHPLWRIRPVGRFDWEHATQRDLLYGLSPSARLVAHQMASYAAKDGGRVSPGVDRLAQSTGYSPRTVIRALAELRTAGVVIRTHAARGPGAGQADEYRLSIPEQVTWVSLGRSKVTDKASDIGLTCSAEGRLPLPTTHMELKPRSQHLHEP
jgi:hypothetical protein